MRRPWLIWLLFVVSGASGLCFELVFTRELGVTLGVTSRAVALVVAVFMAGLAVGNALGVRAALRTKRPAFVYGVVEVGIGATALGATWLLPGLEAFDGMGARVAAGIALVLVPTVLMGATYPLVCEAGHFRDARDAHLYAANTIGAAIGCLLVGFVGIGLVGVRGSATIAAVANVLCGLSAMSIRVGTSTTTGDDAVGSVVPVPPTMAVIALACGASALGAEVLWTRALLPYLNSSTYAFAAILGVYLVFLAMGAAWGAARATWWGLARTRSRLAALQLALGVSLATSIAWMDVVERAIVGYVGVRRVMSFAVWLATVGSVMSRVTLVIGFPALVMGASFALCVKLARGDVRSSAGVAGRISAWNTLGGIAGSLVAGFVLLPRLGVLHALLVCAALNVGVAVALSARAAERRSAILGVVGCIGVAGAALAFALAGRTVPFVGRLAEDGRVILVDEGPQDTTAVVDVRSRATIERTIFSNGISYTGDNRASRRYMRLLGHLPVLLADDPSHALVVCVGTGMTAAAVAQHREVRSLDLVDISPVVPHTLPLFAAVNGRVWRDPRVRLHEADGRQFLGHAARRFGVISLEPPPPRAAGAASLYTVELYARARAHLTRGGALAQWLPLHGLGDVELRLLARTFLRVFPDAALFLLNDDEAALLGWPPGATIDLDAMRRRLAAPGVADGLAQLGLDARSPETLGADLMALSIADGHELATAVGPGPVVTDDRPLVEQFALTLGGRDDGDERAQRLRFLSRFLRAPSPGPRTRGTPFVGEAAAREEMRRRFDQLRR